MNMHVGTRKIVYLRYKAHQLMSCWTSRLLVILRGLLFAGKELPNSALEQVGPEDSFAETSTGSALSTGFIRKLSHVHLPIPEQGRVSKFIVLPAD